jgi:transcriptional regulator with XRE-family HTH domain
MNTPPQSRPKQHSNVIGHYLKEKRQAAGLWQQDVAARADVHTSTISRIESGNLLPSVDVMVRIGEALEADLTELLARLGAQTKGQLPEFEEYLREKYHLSEDTVATVAAYFHRATTDISPELPIEE